MAAKQPTAEDIELVRQTYVQNVNRYNALTKHPRNGEIANELSILSKRMDNDSKLVGQRYTTSKTLGILKIFQQTSGKIGELEGRIGVNTPPPPVVAPIVIRDEKATKGGDKAGAWYMNPWVWAGAGVGLLLLFAMMRGGGGSKED